MQAPTYLGSRRKLADAARGHRIFKGRQDPRARGC